jgi:4'-phosphopantetheinyl transferase
MITPSVIYLAHQTLADLPEGLNWLHPAERRFLETLRFEKRRQDWLLGRWTAKKALFNLLKIPPQSISILKSESGAPLVAFDVPAPPCTLSLSHRAGRALAAVAAGAEPIGCDLEWIEPRSAAFLGDYFLESETAFLARVPPGQKDLYANLFWCAKEAVMKARGEGMRLHPRKIEIAVKEAALSASVLPGEDRFFGFWGSDENYVWAVVRSAYLSPKFA